MASTGMAMTADGAAGESGRTGNGKWWIVGCIVAVGAILSGFFGVNEYASGTGAVIRSADANAGRFEAVFRDLMQARFRAMSLSADVMLQSRVTIEAFARNDRAGLVSRIEPFFDALQREHGVEQLNFWQAPAKLYYRAGRPDEFGMDLSKFRRSIVAATERRQRILAVETGQGGVVALRAIVPVNVDGNFIGVLEFVSSFNLPLERASETTGLGWAVSLNKETSERVERPVEPKLDAWQGNDVYFLFSSPTIGNVLRTISFDPRAKGYTLASASGRTVFAKAFPVINFSGQPTITIALLRDVSADFAGILQSVAMKAGILFLLIAVAGSLGFLKFRQIKAALTGALSRQKQEIDERTRFCDIAVGRLKETDLIKRGFFASLTIAVNEVLQAVSGQLRAVATALASGNAGGHLTFAITETARLSRLVEDYHQLELFRQRLVKNDGPQLPLAGLVARTLDEDLAGFRRLPQLTIAMAVPADLPPTRGDGDLLRRAISNLVAYAVQRNGGGTVTIGGLQDASKWLLLTVTGSAFAGEAAPGDALLDETRQLVARLASGAGASDDGALVGVALARVIVEFFGGRLETSADAPGFVIRLPAAAI